MNFHRNALDSTFLKYGGYGDRYMPGIEDEEKLIKLVASGDMAARNKLIEIYYPLIKEHSAKIANYYAVDSVNDVIQIAFETLVEEASKYDTKKHNNFRGFVSFVIATTLPNKIKELLADSNFSVGKGLISKDRTVDFDLINFRSAVTQALRFLNSRERFVIIHKFGLYGKAKWPLEMIGTKMGGLSRHAVSRLEQTALKKLRNPWCLRSLAHFYVD